VSLPPFMPRRVALALVPLVLVLGCAAAPPPAAAPSAEPALNGAASAAPDADKKTTPPADPKPNAAPAPPPQDAPGRASVTVDAPLTTNITQDAVLALVQKNADAFYRCYTLGAGASKSYRAKVSVKATVGPTGVVNAVEVTTSTSKNPRVDACVVEAFKKLSFARAAGSGTTTFTFPLSFDGLEQVR
jgi:TonB family protein